MHFVRSEAWNRAKNINVSSQVKNITRKDHVYNFWIAIFLCFLAVTCAAKESFKVNLDQPNPIL